jgi:L-threonylcarbamoyladenylate synthase
MNGKVIDTTAELVAAIKAGNIGVIPTDTVYGVVCDAKNPTAVKRLYELKNRHHKPGTLIAANTDQVVDLGLKKNDVQRLAYLWPNPISAVIPAGSKLAYLHQDKDSLAMRIPDDPMVHELLLQTGPLLTSSANIPGEPPATTIQEAYNSYGNAVDFYVDGGELSDRPPSTIVRLDANGKLEILRQGAVHINEQGEII